MDWFAHLLLSEGGFHSFFLRGGGLVVLWLMNAARAVNKPFFESRSVTLQLLLSGVSGDNRFPERTAVI